MNLRSVENMMHKFALIVLCYIGVQVQATQNHVEIPQWRLAGAEEAAAPVPALAYIKTRTATAPEEVSNTCAGAIIAANMVLTTGSCVFGADSAELMAGSTNTSAAHPTDGVQFVNSSKIIVHENFFSNSLDNDIAIITVTPNFTFTDANKVAAIPLPKLPLVNRDAIVRATIGVVGWGNSSTGDGSTVVQALRNMSAITQKDCETQLKQAAYKLSQSSFCVKVSGTNGLCEHDQGSLALAVFNNNRNVVPSLVGLGSDYVGKTCPSQLPNVFTRVGNYLRWIAANGGPK